MDRASIEDEEAIQRQKRLQADRQTDRQGGAVYQKLTLLQRCESAFLLDSVPCTPTMVSLSVRYKPLYSRTQREDQRTSPPIHNEISLTCANMPRGRRRSSRRAWYLFYYSAGLFEAASIKPCTRSGREVTVLVTTVRQDHGD